MSASQIVGGIYIYLLIVVLILIANYRMHLYRRYWWARRPSMKRMILEDMAYKDIMKFVDERKIKEQEDKEEQDSLFDKYKERIRRAYDRFDELNRD